MNSPDRLASDRMQPRSARGEYAVTRRGSPHRATPLLLVGAVALFAQVAGAQALRTPVDDLLNVAASSVQTLDFDEDPILGIVYTTVQVGPQAYYTLELDRRSVRADGFQLLVDDGTGDLRPVVPPPPRTYRGIVLEDPTIRVRGSYADGQLRAVIFDHGQTWAVQPLRELDPTARPGQHVVHTTRDGLPSDFMCGVTATGGFSGGGAGGPLGTGIEICEVGLDADYPYYQDLGSSVSATLADLEDILNSVGGVYEVPGILIGYEVTTVIVRTAPGTYSSSDPDTLLSQFDSNWSSSPESTINRDVAHLFTGRDLIGSVIGIASLSAICSTTNGYGLSQSRYTTNYNKRVSLTAHELGHNWSAIHCDTLLSPCRIMCSFNGGCDGLTPLEFGPSATSQIFGYRGTRTCLSSLANPVDLPFIEPFASSVISGLRWTYRDGVGVSSGGVGEPSAPYSLVLNATGGGPYLDDDIRSNFIHLAGTTDPTLRYFVEHRGVPDGGELMVDYWASTEEWVNITTHVSDGVDQTAYEMHTHTLPLLARHDEFRVRFRADVSASAHKWYVDDVTVTEGPPAPSEPPILTQVFPTAGPVAGGTPVVLTGEFFAPDATVLFGLQELQDFTFIDGTEIHGTTPPALGLGAVTVTVSQTSGADSIADAFTYVDSGVQLTSTQAPVGGTAVLSALATTGADLAGFSLACNFDGTYIDIQGLSVDGTLSEGADFFAPNTDNAPDPGGSWWTVGVVVDLIPPITEFIPAGSDLEILRAEYAISPTAPVGDLFQQTLADGIGAPPVSIVFSVVGGSSTFPTPTSGIIEIVDGAGGFIRGDVNGDGIVDIADPITTLDYLFSSGAISCLDATDTNDDGAVDIADSIYSLAYQFTSGPPPPPPFPTEGPDPTPDGLDCLP